MSRRRNQPHTLETILSHATPVGDCLVIEGSLATGGYGRVMVNGNRELAHRAVWLLAKGPIPSGKIVRHRCDNPPCINIDHLELGTQLDNVRDCIARGRFVQNSPTFKANAADVAAYVASGRSWQDAATEFSISRATVARYLRNERRRNNNE